MGYVGLATAVCFADRGYQVYGVDVDQEKLRIIASGKSPIHEAKIDSLLSRSLRNGNFSVSSDIGEAVKNSSITFVTL